MGGNSVKGARSIEGIPQLPERPGAVQLRTRRSPRLVALGVLMVCLGGLAGAFLYSGAISSQSVLVLARTVQRGRVISADDLAVVSIGSSAGLPAVPAQRKDEFVGKTALLDLPSGVLLVADAVGIPAAPSGSVQVGLKLSPGRVPMSTLPVEAKVLLVELLEGQASPGRTVQATVVSPPRTLSDEVTTIVDVRVPADQGALVGVLAAQDRLALIRQADS